MRRHTYRWIGLLAVVGLLGPALPVRGQEPEITVELPGGATMEMVWIPPGTFTMGGEPDLVQLSSALGPQHEVTLTQGFYLGKFELNQIQWTSVMDTRPWEEFEEDCPNCPATWISWEEADTFVQQLTLLSGGGLIYRLPTEAEWEYAARAGTTTAWSFGDDSTQLDDYAWYRGNTCGNDASECFLHKIGLKLPNPWGLYDMHGNVEEWVFDWGFRTYTEEPQINPVNAERPVYDNSDIFPKRIKRGGGYAQSAVATRSAIRTSVEPQYKTPDKGFRVARSFSVPIETQVIPSGWGLLKHGSSMPHTE